MNANNEWGAKLVELFKAGSLVPITTIKALRQFSPATICRMAMQGRLPAMRVGRRILSHESLIEEALPGFVCSKPEPKTTRHAKDTHAADVVAARARLRSRGLPA